MSEYTVLEALTDLIDDVRTVAVRMDDGYVSVCTADSDEIAEAILEEFSVRKREDVAVQELDMVLNHLRGLTALGVVTLSGKGGAIEATRALRDAALDDATLDEMK